MISPRDPVPQLHERSSAYRVRFWAVLLAAFAIAPALLVFLAIHIYQSAVIGHTEENLRDAHRQLRQISVAEFAKGNKVAASIAAAFGNTAPVQRQPAEVFTAAGAPPANRLEYWTLPVVSICLIVFWLALVGLLTEKRVSQWLRFLSKIARTYSTGTMSAQTADPDRFPTELAPLSIEINHMASSIGTRAGLLEQAIRERAKLLHEIHHRVKNNFAIVASLLSLHRKSLPENLRPDIRFLEEHVQATAAAYKVAYAAEDTSNVPVIHLIRDVVPTLMEIAKRDEESIVLRYPHDDALIPLDKAIALALCFAYRLPFYLEDSALEGPIEVDISIGPEHVTFLFKNLPFMAPVSPALRERLSQAYFRQLRAEITELQSSPMREVLLRIPLHD